MSDNTKKESAITFIRPRILLDILRTCHFINDEATSIFQRKLRLMETYPIKYLLDMSALRALMSEESPYSSCLGLKTNAPTANIKGRTNRFITQCGTLVHHLRCNDRTIHMEFTIIIEGEETHDLVSWLPMFRLYMLGAFPGNCFSIVHQGPFFARKINGRISHENTERRRLDRELVRIYQVYRSPSWPDLPDLGPLVGLGGDAFLQHLEDLEHY